MIQEKKKWMTPICVNITGREQVQGGANAGFKEALKINPWSGNGNMVTTFTNGGRDSSSIGSTHNGCRKFDGVLQPQQTTTNTVWRDGAIPGTNVVSFNQTGCS